MHIFESIILFNGVLVEIKFTREQKKPVRYFRIIDSNKIEEISKEEVEFEGDLEQFSHEL